MKNWPRIALAVLVGLLLFGLSACPKKPVQNVPGPGGLPRGIVEEGNAPDMDPDDLPLYPGATKRAAGAYETTASLEQVITWYRDKLGVEPEIRGEHGETRAFVMDAYEVVLVPVPEEAGGGTEINFKPLS